MKTIKKSFVTIMILVILPFVSFSQMSNRTSIKSKCQFFFNFKDQYLTIETSKVTPPLKYSQNKIIVGFEQLLNSIKLDPQTGELTIEKIQVKNLPNEDVNGNSVSYGLNNNDHKLILKIVGKNKEIGSLAYYSNPNSLWNDAYSTSDEKYKKEVFIKEGGDYKIELFLDDKNVYSLNIEVLEVVDKSGKSGLFVSKPFEILGKLAFKDQSYGEPNLNSELIFSFYYAWLNVEDSWNDELTMNVRLLRNSGNEDFEILGGTFEGTLRPKSRWEITDNIFFEKPDQRYVYVTGNEVLQKDGNYIIDIFVGNEHFQYEFDVKNGQIVSSDYPGIDDGGAYWLKRKSANMPKYETFKPTANTAGLKDNISLMVSSLDGKTVKGCGAGVPVSFTDGQKIQISQVYFKDAIKQKYAYQNTEYITTLKKGSEIIAQHIIFRMFGSQNFSLIATSGDIDMKNDFYTSVFMEALSNLPAGSHQLTLVLELSSGKKTDLIGVQNITFVSNADNSKYKKQAKLLNERLLMSESELTEVRFLKYGGQDWALYENNCGRIVWLRQDESKEYYLYPGNVGMFDRNAGVLEQWNFSTLKWNVINDFSPYKTIYKLTNNELAMLNMKKVPTDITEKLMPIAGKEFSSRSDFENECVKLIGKENYQKYETLLVMHADIDFIKVCNK